MRRADLMLIEWAKNHGISFANAVKLRSLAIQYAIQNDRRRAASPAPFNPNRFDDKRNVDLWNRAMNRTIDAMNAVATSLGFDAFDANAVALVKNGQTINIPA